MEKYGKALKILGVLAVGGCIQVLLVLIGTACVSDWPGSAAIEFTRAHFQKDPAIADRICRAHSTDADIFAIEDDRQRTAETAISRGFDFTYMTSMVYHVKTKTDYISDTEATVHLTGKRRVSINPVYFIVSILFNIGEAHRIDETVTVIKEGDLWKVCEDYSSVFQDV